MYILYLLHVCRYTYITSYIIFCVWLLCSSPVLLSYYFSTDIGINLLFTASVRFYFYFIVISILSIRVCVNSCGVVKSKCWCAVNEIKSWGDVCKPQNDNTSYTFITFAIKYFLPLEINVSWYNSYSTQKL